MFAVSAKILASLAAVLLWVGSANAAAPGEPDFEPNFVLVNELFEGDATQPYSVHRIVFRHNADGLRCYDRDPGQPSRTTVFDFGEQLVHLIDRSSRSTTTLPIAAMVDATARFDAQVADPQARVRLGLDTNIDADGDGRLHARFGDVAYEVQTRSAIDPAEAARIGQFVDAACRLNFVQGLGLPPFARLRLNAQIVRRGRVATRTHVTLHTTGETIRMQTERQKATAADVAWSRDVDSLQSLCRVTSLDQYAQATRPSRIEARQ